MAFDDFLAKCKANAGPGVFRAAVEPLKDDEDPLEVLGAIPMPLSRTANSIIGSPPHSAMRWLWAGRAEI